MNGFNSSRPSVQIMVCRLVSAETLSAPMMGYFSWNVRNKLLWNLKRAPYISLHENVFENVVCEMTVILFRPQCVKINRAVTSVDKTYAKSRVCALLLGNWTTWGPLRLYNSTLILAWIRNYILVKNTHSFPNFNHLTVEVWERISNFIPHFTIDVIT